MVRPLLAVLALVLVVPAASAQAADENGPADRLIGALQELRDADSARYEVVLSQGEDLRSSPLVIRTIVLADMHREKGLVAYRADARMSRDGSRGAERLLLTKSEDAAQLIDYADRTEHLLTPEQIGEVERAGYARLAVHWLETLANDEALESLREHADAVASLGEARSGRELCEVLRVNAGEGDSMRFYIAERTGQIDRIDARVAGLGDVVMRLSKLRTDVRVPETMFEPQRVPRGYTTRDHTEEASAADGADEPASEHVAETGVNEGDLAPDFTLQDPDGRAHRLSDYRGKVVLIDFWGVWCHWCKVAMPHIAKMHRELADDGLVVLGVNVGDPSHDVPINYMNSHGYDHTLLLDGRPVAQQYKVSGYPTMFLVGPDGRIMKRYGGYSEEREAEMERLIRDTLGVE